MLVSGGCTSGMQTNSCCWCAHMHRRRLAAHLSCAKLELTIVYSKLPFELDSTFDQHQQTAMVGWAAAGRLVVCGMQVRYQEALNYFLSANVKDIKKTLPKPKLRHRMASCFKRISKVSVQQQTCLFSCPGSVTGSYVQLAVDCHSIFCSSCLGSEEQRSQGCQPPRCMRQAAVGFTRHDPTLPSP